MQQITVDNKETPGTVSVSHLVYMSPEEGFADIGVTAVMDSASGQERLPGWFFRTDCVPVNTTKWWLLLSVAVAFSDGGIRSGSEWLWKVFFHLQ